ncbi:MAG: tail fiber domain-containing protein, partial [Terriglobales bacterium]
TSTDNTAVGYTALQNAVGSSGNIGYNTAIGSQALAGDTTGFANTASGYQALSANTTGTGNTASGYLALVENTTGSGNTAIGDITLQTNTTGLANTALGSNAGSTADFSFITGSNNTFLGYNTGPSTGSLTNATAIGALTQVWQSNTLVLGATNGVNGATSDTRVGIADNTPTNLLTLGQGHGKALADGWSTYSSRRWKTNIQTLPDALAKVEKLRGVSYDLKENGQHEIGVIAEEVGAVLPEVVTFENNGKDARSVDYSRLTALLIEAVKAQQKQIAALRGQLKQRAAKDAALETRLAKLEKGSEKAKTRLASAQIVPASPRP